MAMYGADTAALRSTGRGFLESSAMLLRHREQMSAVFRTVAWTGADAEASREEWSRVGDPALARTGAFMETLGTTLLAHADDQDRASGIVGGPRHGFAGGLVERAREVFTGVVVAVDEAVDEVVDSIDDLFDRLFGSPEPATSPSPAVPIEGRRPEPFGDPADGRASVLAAMEGFADESRIGRDEIEIRALDNGRYVVVLPGVTDLSAGFDRFARQVREDGLFGIPEGGRDAYDTWADNDEPTVRKMRYAYEAALRDDTTVNEYSTVVAEALETAGVPAGAEVMLVGHSFGAYTAVDLAVEPTFNVAVGAALRGYHVDVTHVVAAGAETDWRFDEIPRGTRTLMLNNRWDAVYQAENLLHQNESPESPGHLEVEFWGGREGYGHDEHNYLDWLAGTDGEEVQRWLDDVGERYASAGTRVSVPVPDPALD